MTNLINGFFALELGLLLTHEMDAIRHKEWEMFIFLKDLPENTAYLVFTLPHILLYALVLFFLLLNNITILYVVDIFVICHLFIHFIFRRHLNNQLTGFWSLVIINLAGIIAAVHLILMAAER
ncbi:DUF6713 family protein [Enterococcus avium]|uniref:DUF6713 family protein n=1 Tax=Enterococcus avium TaxID=33945 RepID=UPI0028901EDE|nr:DUF6713 family protein [Enterococcus avium]MDT2381019.1 hypothetical protein [Enterococcus avium]MDT2385321.1 hypothetical protein [Enterococcus avium]MDT2462608.1 hypothetical protein [Enterococcus avium]MDT2496565.1 hypothetical protein [Enterococcus avium]